MAFEMYIKNLGPLENAVQELASLKIIISK